MHKPLQPCSYQSKAFAQILNKLDCCCLQHTPPVPPQMFQHRPSPSKHPMPSMPGTPGMHGMRGMPGMSGPGPRMMHTPRTPPFPRHPYPMIHSDPGGYQANLLLSPLRLVLCTTNMMIF